MIKIRFARSGHIYQHEVTYIIIIFLLNTFHIINFYNQSTCTQVLLKIQYLYLYLYSSFFQVLVLVLEYFCLVLAPSLLQAWHESCFTYSLPVKWIARMHSCAKNPPRSPPLFWQATSGKQIAVTLKGLAQAKIIKNRWFYFGFLIWPYDVHMSID